MQPQEPEPGSAASRPRVSAPWVAGLVALGLGLLALPGGFLFDDVDIVQNNRRLDSVASIPALFGDSYWGKDFPRRLYRPLVLTSFVLDTTIGKRSSPTVYHVTSALLYALATVLVVLLAQRLGARRGTALAAGLLFAVHPIHTEAYANLVGRAELMAAIGLLSALILAQPPLARRMDWRRSSLIALCFLGGMLSKESAIAILPLLAFMPILGGEAGAPWWRAALAAARERWRMWALLALATLVWIGMRARAIPPIGETLPVGDLDNYLHNAPAPARVAGALAVTLRYLGMSVWPWPLSADYSYAAIVPPTEWTSPVVYLGGLVWVAGIVVALAARRRAPLIALGAAVWVACLIPVANLLVPIGTIFGERLLFMPSIGICLILAAAGGDLARRRAALRPYVLATLGVVLVLGAVGSGLRVREWQTEARLFESDLRKHPESAKLHAKLGSACWAATLALEEGSPAHRAGLQRAAAHLERALEIYPRMVQAAINLSLVLVALGDGARATEISGEALALASDHLPAVRAYAQVACKTGRPGSALAECDRMLERHPGDRELLEVRLDALYRLGRLADVVAGFEPALAAGGSFERASAFADHLLGRGEIALAGSLNDLLLDPAMAQVHARAQRQAMPGLILRRGVIANDLGRPAAALEDADALLAADPAMHRARALRVEALVALGRLDEAGSELRVIEAAVGEQQAAGLRALLEGRR